MLPNIMAVIPGPGQYPDMPQPMPNSAYPNIKRKSIFVFSGKKNLFVKIGIERVNANL